MGEVIGIREQTGPFEYRLWFTTNGEERQVRIDPDKRDLFLSQDILEKRPIACPFLRERTLGTVICTVHQTRPDLCRQYGCFRILVCNRRGERLGRVMDNTRYFTTMNHELRALWDKEIAPITIADEMCWEEEVARILSAAGYQVLR
jgi:Fe-S-cluster containining protein